jgi:hypothetical protein
VHLILILPNRWNQGIVLDDADVALLPEAPLIGVYRLTNKLKRQRGELQIKIRERGIIRNIKYIIVYHMIPIIEQEKKKE